MTGRSGTLGLKKIHPRRKDRSSSTRQCCVWMWWLQLLQWSCYQQCGQPEDTLSSLGITEQKIQNNLVFAYPDWTAEVIICVVSNNKHPYNLDNLSQSFLYHLKPQESTLSKNNDTIYHQGISQCQVLFETLSVLTYLIITTILRVCEGTAQAGYRTCSRHPKGGRKAGMWAQ